MPISVFHMFRFSWRHPIEAFKDLLRIIRYSYQRITKGYCDYDVGDIDIWFEAIMPNMLRQLKTVQSGYPMEMVDEYYELHRKELRMSEQEFSYAMQYDEELVKKVYDWSRSRWQDILEKMSCAFENIDKARDSHDLAELEKYKEYALALFGKYYFNLWN